MCEEEKKKRKSEKNERESKWMQREEGKREDVEVRGYRKRRGSVKRNREEGSG